MDEVCDLMRLQHYAIQTERAYCSTLATEGSLERRHSTAGTSAPGDEAVRLTFPIDTASRWSSVRGSDIHALLCKPKPMKISLISPQSHC